MRHDLLKFASVFALAVMLGTAPAMAADINDWDSNGDGIVDQDEFGTGFGETGLYDGWDADGDGLLSDDEFTAGVYDSYDADGSGDLDDDEIGVLEDDMGEEGFWDV